MNETLHIAAVGGQPRVETSGGNLVSGVSRASIVCEPGELPKLMLEITNFTGDFKALDRPEAR